MTTTGVHHAHWVWSVSSVRRVRCMATEKWCPAARLISRMWKERRDWAEAGVPEPHLQGWERRTQRMGSCGASPDSLVRVSVAQAEASRDSQGLGNSG